MGIDRRRRRSLLLVSTAGAGTLLFLICTVIIVLCATLSVREGALVSPQAFADLSARKSYEERIPRRIHQIFLSDTATDLPVAWRPISATCRKLHPDYHYQLWTQASARSFVTEHFPQLLEMYEGYEHDVQRADVLRYLLLHKLGGVYLDMDVGCKESLDPLLGLEMVLPLEKRLGVNQDFIMASPNNPFLAAVVGALPAFNDHYGTRFHTVLISTGPIFLSIMLWLFGKDVKVIDAALYGKNLADGPHHESLFHHYYARGWLGRWATVNVFIDNNLESILLLACLTLLLCFGLGANALATSRLARRDEEHCASNWTEKSASCNGHDQMCAEPSKYDICSKADAFHSPKSESMSQQLYLPAYTA